MIKVFELDSEEITAWISATLANTNTDIQNYEIANKGLRSWVGGIDGSNKIQFTINNRLRSRSLRLKEMLLELIE